MAEETVTTLKQIEIVFTKIWPYLFLGGLWSAVKFAALINNGTKISIWKMCTSTFLAVAISGLVGYAIDDQIGTVWMKYAITGGVAIMGEKAILYLIINSTSILDDLRKVFIKRIGGKTEE